MPFFIIGGRDTAENNQKKEKKRELALIKWFIPMQAAVSQLAVISLIIFFEIILIGQIDNVRNRDTTGSDTTARSCPSY